MSDGLIKLKTSTVTLPSQNHHFNKDILVNGDSVKVRNFLMEDHRKCAGAAATLSIYSYFKTVLETFLVEPSPKQLNLDDFLMSDLLVVLYSIKAASWGDEFGLDPFKCVKCGNTESPVLSISKFDVLYADEIPDFKTKGLEYELAGHKITCHLNTVADEGAVQTGLKNLKKMNKLVNVALDESILRVAQAIDTIDGKQSSLIQKFESLLKLPPEESEKLSDFIYESDVGILLDTFEVNCPKCGYNNSEEVDLGFSPTFFRPPVRNRAVRDGETKASKARRIQLSRHSFADPTGIRGSVPESTEDDS
jgi:predicted nucleic-acid-binding Zn-ribbon protein